MSKSKYIDWIKERDWEFTILSEYDLSTVKNNKLPRLVKGNTFKNPKWKLVGEYPIRSVNSSMGQSKKSYHCTIKDINNDNTVIVPISFEYASIYGKLRETDDLTMVVVEKGNSRRICVKNDALYNFFSDMEKSITTKQLSSSDVGKEFTFTNNPSISYIYLGEYSRVENINPNIFTEKFGNSIEDKMDVNSIFSFTSETMTDNYDTKVSNFHCYVEKDRFYRTEESSDTELQHLVDLKRYLLTETDTYVPKRLSCLHQSIKNITSDLEKLNDWQKFKFVKSNKVSKEEINTFILNSNNKLKDLFSPMTNIEDVNLNLGYSNTALEDYTEQLKVHCTYHTVKDYFNNIGSILTYFILPSETKSFNIKDILDLETNKEILMKNLADENLIIYNKKRNDLFKEEMIYKFKHEASKYSIIKDVNLQFNDLNVRRISEQDIESFIEYVNVDIEVD